MPPLILQVDDMTEIDKIPAQTRYELLYLARSVQIILHNVQGGYFHHRSITDLFLPERYRSRRYRLRDECARFLERVATCRRHGEVRVRAVLGESTKAPAIVVLIEEFEKLYERNGMWTDQEPFDQRWERRQSLRSLGIVLRRIISMIEGRYTVEILVR